MKNKELLLEVIDFFIASPFEEKYLGIRQRGWRLFLQANFQDAVGKWLDLEDPEFFEKIREILIPQPEELTPNIPSNLAELVDAWEKAKAEGKKEKVIKKSLAKEIEAAQRALRNQWEIGRHENLLKNDLEPKIEELQKKVAQEVETFVRQFPELAGTSEAISQAISEKITEKSLADPERFKEGVLRPIVQETLRERGITQTRAAEIGKTITEEFVAEPILKNFRQQAALLSLKDFVQRRRAYLEKKAEDPEYKTVQGFQGVQTLALIQAQEFVRQRFQSVKEDLRTKLGLSETEIDQLSLDTSRFISQQTFLSQRPGFFTQPEEKLTESIKKAVSEAFEYHLRRPAITGLVSAIRNSIPLLRTRKAKAAFEIVDKLRPEFENPPPEFISLIKTATLTNYALAEESIEAGNPLGRLPSYVLRNIAIMKEETLFTTPPEDFVNLFQEYWQEEYDTKKRFSASQRAAIKRYVEFLREFQKINPAGFKLFRWHQKHLIGISWGKAVAGYFIKYPDYLLHFPFIFGKFWIQNKWALKWEYTWKPKVFGFIINKVPGIGQIVGFLYKKDEWGIYKGPIKRIKSKIQKFILQKGIKGTGRLIWKIGKKLGIDALRKLGVKIFAAGLTGGIGALFFAFYPFFKKVLKKIVGFLGLIALGILHWAVSYGIPGLIGFGVGTLGGGFAAFKVGALVFGATSPFLGPFAIIPSVLAGGLTWLGCMAAGTGLGILIKKAWLGIKGFFSSLLAPEMAGTVGGALPAIELTSYAAIVPGTLAGIAGLAFGTLMITSSAFIIPTEEKVYGSRYIQIQKGFDINGQAQEKLVFENDEVVGKNLNYGFKVTIVEKPLNNVVVSDKLEIIKKEVTVHRDKTWNLGKMEPNDSWETNYTIKPDENFKDSYLSNTVTVTSEEGETQTLTLTLTIGQPPVPESVALARKIVNTLLACPGLLKKMNGVIVSQASWPIAERCLIKAGIPSHVIAILGRFKNQFYHLQCVHFVVAVTGGDLPSKSAAKDYCTQATAGYTLATNWGNIKEGDLIASSRGEAGHIAFVVRRIKNSQGELLYTEVAEAIGTNGVVQYRRISKETLISRYCGYLRKGG